MTQINNLSRRKFISGMSCACGTALILPSCAEVAMSDRKQIRIFSDNYLHSKAFPAYENFKSQSKLITGTSESQKIVDIGFVGQPKKLNKDMLTSFIKNGQIPVISPLGKDENNFTYNINADTVAGFIAGELQASKLLLLTDVPGILDKDEKLISSITLEEAKNIANKEYISGGMKPKINTCIDAMKKGLDEAIQK